MPREGKEGQPHQEHSQHNQLPAARKLNGWASRNQKLSHTARGNNRASVLISNRRRAPESERLIGDTNGIGPDNQVLVRVTTTKETTTLDRTFCRSPPGGSSHLELAGNRTRSVAINRRNQDEGQPQPETQPHCQVEQERINADEQKLSKIATNQSSARRKTHQLLDATANGTATR